jgi:hypothetical protein
MTATTATQTITLTVGTAVVLDLVGATGTVVNTRDNGDVEIRWARNGKSFWYGRNISYRLAAA